MWNRRKCISRNRHFFRSPEIPFGVTRLLDGDDGGGGGASGPEAPRQNAADVVTRYSGDAVRMAGQIVDVETDNYKLQRKRDDLQRDLDAVKGRVPADDAVVLTAEDARAWEVYKALGKPDEVKASLATGQAAIAERNTFRRAQTLEDAAKAANLKPGVLKLLAKDADVQVREIDALKQDGTTEKQKVAVVVTRDAAGKESDVPIRDYFKAQGEDVLQSLDAGESNGFTNNGLGNVQDNIQGGHLPAQGGTSFPPQNANGGAQNAASSPAQSVMASRYTPPSQRRAAREAQGASR